MLETFQYADVSGLPFSLPRLNRDDKEVNVF